MAQASDRAGYEVVEPAYLPESIDAERFEVWYSDMDNQSGLRYDSDLVLTFREWPDKSENVQLQYENMAKEWEAGEATTLGEYPAWIVPADAQGLGAPPVNLIYLTRGNVEITFYYRGSMEELRRIAESTPPISKG